jgi:ActR/RegA family two-component response regulator
MTSKGISKGFSQEVKATLNFVGSEDFTAKNKHYYVYFFQLENEAGLRMIKVISEISPDLASRVVLTSYNNQISVRIE